VKVRLFRARQALGARLGRGPTAGGPS
jgi:hypothetical protein